MKDDLFEMMTAEEIESMAKKMTDLSKMPASAWDALFEDDDED